MTFLIAFASGVHGPRCYLWGRLCPDALSVKGWFQRVEGSLVTLITRAGWRAKKDGLALAVSSFGGILTPVPSGAQALGLGS